MKNKTNDFYEDDMAVGEGWSNIDDRGSSDGRLKWTEGEVATKFGYVIVYAQDDLLTLRFVYGGRIYMKTWRHGFGKKTIASFAKKFAAEKAGQK